MALYTLWIFFTLCPFLVYSQSGDDAGSDTEASTVYCSSMLSIKQTNLSCVPEFEDIDLIKHAELCEWRDCINATMLPKCFTFEHLLIPGQYKLSVYFKDGSKFHQDINLVKVVKITDPEVYNATYSSEEVLIFIKYQHEYVTDPLFQLEIWSDGVGKKTVWNYTRKRMTIPKNWLTGGKTNHVHVRAKPVEYFDGSWTHWSPKKSFLVEGSKEESLVTYIIFCTCLALVVCFLTLVLRWKKEIKAYISPSIPNPKEALAQIHREKEHPPVSFSPEMFNDVSINRVDFAEQKLIPELDEGQEDSTGSCQTESVGSLPASVFDKQNGNDRQLEEEISHLKIRLLDQPEDGKNENASHRLATLQSHKDETYVTMSSLYKTQ